MRASERLSGIDPPRAGDYFPAAYQASVASPAGLSRLWYAAPPFLRAGMPMELDWFSLMPAVLAAAALVQSWLVVLYMVEQSRYVRGRLKRQEKLDSTLRVELFAPCKGHEPGLEDNLRALLRQDYANYQVAFIVESADDPAVVAIETVRREFSKVATRLVVAGLARDTGQKVHNLLRATESLDDTVQVLAFVDSDARPRATWLRALVSRVDHDDIGAVTGYRWFVPLEPTTANDALAVLNAWVASMLGPGGHQLVWGGSWAIRREHFEAIGLRQAWRNTLSDDLVASRVLHDSKRRVEFEPACMIASPLSTSWTRLFSFARRQYLIGKFYRTGWWLTAYLWTTLAVAGLWTAILGTVALAARGDWLWRVYAACLAGLVAAHCARWAIRWRLAKKYLPEHADALSRMAWFEMAAWPVLSIALWAAMFASLFGRTIRWRDIRYELGCGGRIVSMRREGALEPPRGLRIDTPAPRAPSRHIAAQAQQDFRRVI